jgi:hypothetical protein
MRLYQQSLEIKERLGDLKGKSATLHEMAYIYVTRGDLDGAMRLYQQVLENGWNAWATCRANPPRCTKWPESTSPAATWTGRCASTSSRSKSLSAWVT